VEGSVHVGGTLAAPRLSGRVTSRSGEVAFLGTTFRLTGGQAVFSEALGTEPQISARAQQVYGDTVVFLDVTGPATHPELTLTANPPMAQEDLIALVARNAGIVNPESVLGQGLGQFLLGPVREALHLSEFTITYSRESPVTLRIGKFLMENLYLTISQVWPGPIALGVPSTPPFTAFPRQLLAGESYAVGGLEYFLSPNLSLMFSADSLGEDGIFVLTRFFL
jgi:translocation and assembly module TamB